MMNECSCAFAKEKITNTALTDHHHHGYEVVCPNSVLGCQHSCRIRDLATHLQQQCPHRGVSSGEEEEERNRWKRVVIAETEEERARRVTSVSQGSDEERQGRRRSNLKRVLESQVQGAVTALHHEVGGARVSQPPCPKRAPF